MNPNSVFVREPTVMKCFLVTAALTFESTDLFNTVLLYLSSLFFLYDGCFLTCFNDVFKCILEEINRVFFISIYIFKKKTNVCASLCFGRTENTGKSWKKEKEKKNTVWFLRFHFISTVLPFLGNAVFPPYLVNFFFFFFLKARPYLCVALNRVRGVVEGRIVSSLDAAHLKGKGERYKDWI